MSDATIKMSPEFYEAITLSEQIRIDQLEATVMSLRAIIDAKLHRRKCYTCGHVGYYAAGVVPYCLCDNCKSQDTRKVKP